MQDEATQELELVIDFGPDLPAGILVQEVVVKRPPAKIVDFNRLLGGLRGVGLHVEGFGEDWGVAVRAFQDDLAEIPGFEALQVGCEPGAEATWLGHPDEGVEDGFDSVFVGGVEVDVEGCVGDGVPVVVNSGDEGYEVVIAVLQVYTVALSVAGVCD